MKNGEFDDLRGAQMRRRAMSYARSVKSIAASMDRSEARSNRIGWILALFLVAAILLAVHAPRV